MTVDWVMTTVILSPLLTICFLLVVAAVAAIREMTKGP